MIKKLIMVHILLFTINNMYGVNDKIFSYGNSSTETLARFLSRGNNELGEELVYEFASIYIEEAKLEGINWDIAFVQMCLETGFLKYGGLVEVGQNNFCGLGSFDNKQGASFSTIREGVRAHVQHLKAYSSTEDLNGVLLDPRFHLVQRGSAQNVNELAGRWAEDPKYGKKIISLLQRINHIENGDVILKAEVPMGFEAVTTPDEMIVTQIFEDSDYTGVLQTEDVILPYKKIKTSEESVIYDGTDNNEEGWLR